MQNLTFFVAICGPVISTVPGGIKLWETWRDRPRPAHRRILAQPPGGTPGSGLRRRLRQYRPDLSYGDQGGCGALSGSGEDRANSAPPANPLYRNGRHKGIQHKTGAGDGGKKGRRGHSDHTGGRYCSGCAVFSKNNQGRLTKHSNLRRIVWSDQY